MLVHAERTLDLVTNRLVSGTVGVVILGAANLVTKGLGGGLVGVCCRVSNGGENEDQAMPTRLSLTGSLVSSTGDALLGLVKGGLGRVGSLGLSTAVAKTVQVTYELLLSLGVEILASGLRHVDIGGSGCGWVECAWL